MTLVNFDSFISVSDNVIHYIIRISEFFSLKESNENVFAGSL